MKISLVITFGCLLLAILLTVFAETASPHRVKTGSRFATAAYFCCYGVWVRVVSPLIGYFLQLQEWLAIAIAVPLGIPIVLFAGKVAES